MLPGVGISSVTGKIAYGIIAEIFAVPIGQQITPGAVTISVVDGTEYRTKAACGVGIFLAAGDVAGIVICPDPGLTRCLIILPGQLVRTVVAVCGRIGCYHCHRIRRCR